MEIINITKHSAFRYLQRIKNNLEIITETQFNNLVKSNPNEFEEIKKEILEKLKEKHIEFLGRYKIRNNEESDIYLDKDNRIIYIGKKENLITCYKLNFIKNEDSNKEIFNAFMKEIDYKKDLKINLETELLNEEIKNNNSIDSINLEIKKLKQEINKLEEEKKEMLNHISFKKVNLEVIVDEIKVTIQKMLSL